ncbi:MAG TPA: ComF family protein [archaeon]|nr:ComF family protein [archaeon]
MLGLQAADSLLDLFYPPGCMACGRSVSGADIVLCQTCLKGLVLLSAEGCPRCGSPEEEDKKCITCGRLAAELETVRSAAWFMGPVPELIHRFKYQGLHRLALFCAEIMTALPWAGDLIGESDILVPVPLHRWRKMRRGYNQSEKLSGALSALWGKEMVSDIFIRARRTRSQTRLKPEERRANVAGAFSVVDPAKVYGRSILLIDDVMTTGTTLSACAVTLKKAGAKKILGFTFARA